MTSSRSRLVRRVSGALTGALASSALVVVVLPTAALAAPPPHSQAKRSTAAGAAAAPTVAPAAPAVTAAPTAAPPVASITSSCRLEQDGTRTPTGLVVTVANPPGAASAPAVVTITVGTAVEVLTVAVGATESRTYPLTGGTTVAVRVVWEDVTLVDTDYTASCPGRGARDPAEPVATVMSSCTAVRDGARTTSGLVLVLDNAAPPGSLPALFTIARDGVVVETVKVRAGPASQVTRSYAVPAGATTVVRVTATGMTPVVARYTANCVPPVLRRPAAPTASVTTTCPAGATAARAVLTLANTAPTGAAPAPFTVRRDGLVVGTFRVAAGSRTVRSYALASDGSSRFVVTSGGRSLLDRTLTRTCVRPAPTRVLGVRLARPTPPPAIATPVPTSRARSGPPRTRVLGVRLSRTSDGRLPRTGGGLPPERGVLLALVLMTTGAVLTVAGRRGLPASPVSAGPRQR